ncbi:MAG TPA: Hpt domain-containing protein [Aurantimonas coralicida]|uniref:Hpt domain-containing protein n=2 Tax=root TaxID=1 RepID=A0A9C9TFX9_9HYPH|nr:Hpt domain-containing protein [Aurantimonas coralicida]HET99190.1 Hpt domain-containing protein [Aurantimonas coralicida]
MHRIFDRGRGSKGCAAAALHHQAAAHPYSSKKFKLISTLIADGGGCDATGIEQDSRSNRGCQVRRMSMAAATRQMEEASTIELADGAARCPSGRRPIDLVHLARQTSGDRGLETEVLGLLLRHLELFEGRLEIASEDECRFIAHALKGTARNIGAFPLADAAQRFEDSVLDDEAVAALRAELDQTARFVRSLLG